jgi:amidohydrolase
MQTNPGKDVVAAIEKASPELRSLSMKIHDHPELGYQEVFAHKTLTDFLTAQGFHVTKHACGIPTAFIAEFEHPGADPAQFGSPIRSIGFCSEYDALPAIGHGCGHNLIAIAGVGAAMGVKAAMEKNKIRGRVRLLGTPAEETLGGKRPMLEKGAFEGLDACLMVHPGQFDILYRQPLGVGRLEVEFHGKAAHASASPWEGELTSLQMTVPRL